MKVLTFQGLMAFQQFSGINDMVFYTEEIFADAGGSVQGSSAAAIVGGVQVRHFITITKRFRLVGMLK